VNKAFSSISLAELADFLGAELLGNGSCRVRRPASLAKASPEDISFFSDQRQREVLHVTRAGAVILASRDCELFRGNRLIIDNPYRAFVEVCHRLSDAYHDAPAGIDPLASIHPSATISDDVAVGPYAVIGQQVVLDSGVVIGANSSIGSGATIGRGSRIAAGVTIYPGCAVGAYCNIESGVVIGAPGFGYLESDGQWEPVPQLGSVTIGDRVDIGANTTIDRGSLDDTIIEDGVKLDNQIQVAHNVFIGAHTAIAGCTAIAGSARVGRRCRIGGRVSITGHLTVGDDVTILATSVVTRSVSDGGTYSSHLMSQPAARWRRVLSRLPELDDLFKRVRHLEKARSMPSGTEGD
jgi:UDP-3-O-[3-hydroxymyristoyl] glucosamine N-acyltransferase